ncbi:RNA polymerase sigma factor (sigma-70 family) [Kitasatospora herbaricolor]|uniref:sigma-70 family RNA polymerase sigma factor n=1 Tax=Kitasatospora herbaricolor TaxID=68217 RepID=UPI00174888C2|nr:sigma-70 family RNA polymerase sigma factor [Kitasatospora herbaricolor]MDQ0305547.1 RNA polymerase sigma factor (sigma-70 family) [Kitasatospora herbaricolor]
MKSLDDPTTSALALAAQQGDQAALDRLLRSCLPLVYHLAARALAPDDADDVVQETMIRAVAGLPGLRKPDRFRSWLVSITIQETRRRGTRLSEQRRRFTELDPDRCAPPVAASEEQAVEGIHLSDERRRFVRAATWLDARDRELLDLWWLVQAGVLERAELAPALGVSAGHARVRMQRLRNRVDAARRIEEALEAAARDGGCPTLGGMVRSWDGERSSVWRKRFTRHVDDCGQCRSHAADLLPPERLLAALPLFVPPVHLTSGPGATAVVAAAQFPGPALPRGGLRGLRHLLSVESGRSAALAAVAVVVAVGVVTAVVTHPSGHPRTTPSTVPRPVAPTTAPGVTGSPEPSASIAPPSPVSPSAPPLAPSPAGVGAGSGGPSWTSAQMPPTQGGRYLYVSATGDDRAAGTSRATAVRTLQQAATLTRPGDTVLVDGGRYSAPGKPNVLNIDTSGTPSHWITYAAYPGTRPVVLATGWQGIHVHASYVTVSGFTVRGNSPDMTPAQREEAEHGNTSDPAVNGNCIAVDEQKSADPPRRPHHVQVWGNTVTDCPLNGISAHLADYVTVSYNIVARNAWYSPYGGSGISLHGSWNSDGATGAIKMVVEGNVVHDNKNTVPSAVSGFTKITDGHGIIVDSSENQAFRGAPLYQAAYTGRTLIENNVSYGNGGAGVAVFDSGNVDIVNNTLYHNARSAELRFELALIQAHDITVANTVAVPAPGEVAAHVPASAVRVRLTANLFCGAAESGGAGGGGAPDPRFVDPGGADFRLSSGSPAIDAGFAEAAPADDADRLPRDAPPDLGAYEHR